MYKRQTEDYAIEDCPTWVDRAYPSDLIIQQYNWSGAYLSLIHISAPLYSVPAKGYPLNRVRGQGM